MSEVLTPTESMESPASFSQERLWFIDKLEGSNNYHEQIILRIEGSLNIVDFSFAVRQVVNRHDVLRTVFREHEGAILQRVLEAGVVDLRVHDCSRWSQEKIQATIIRLSETPFDLSHDATIRATLFQLAEGDHLFVLVIHHIACDAWSKSLLLQELMELYQAAAAGRNPALKPLGFQYAEYARREREESLGTNFERKLNYWIEKLSGTTVLNMPTDYLRPAKNSYRGSTVSNSIDSALVNKLRIICREQKVTLFMMMLTAFKILLSRYSGQTDICVGTPVANRKNKEVEPLVGLFVNTIVIRSNLATSSTFDQLLLQMRATCLDAFAHQDVPFEKIVQRVEKHRQVGRIPLFDVMFAFHNVSDADISDLGDLKITPMNLDSTGTKFDLCLDIVDGPAAVLKMTYSSDLYHQESIKRLLNNYIALLNSIAENPRYPVNEMPTLARDERDLILFGFNEADRFEGTTTILDAIESQAKKTPERVAAIFESKTISYCDLDLKSNDLAFQMRSKGVLDCDYVPILTSRGIDFMVAFIATLKAGASCVPLSINWPLERIREILIDLSPKLVLSNSSQLSDELKNDFEVVSVDFESIALKDSPPLRKVALHDPIYIFYTSGSTGKPKGVVVPHQGILNRFQWMNEYFGHDSAKSVLRTTKHIFDSSVWQLFWPLTCGGKTVIPSEIRPFDLEYFVSLVRQHQITMTDFVPVLFNEVANDIVSDQLHDISSLRDIIVGGEAIEANSVKKFLKHYPGIRLTNLYGPTEASIGCVYYEIKDQVDIVIPIGKPISNVKIYIVDSHNQLCPIGVPGELCISGVCLGYGYLNDPVRSSKLFVSNPFSDSANTQRMYRTGDVGRWLADGNIQFLGRIDLQVKIRGFRIELGEIESNLLAHPAIAQVVVTVVGIGTDKQLAAYYVAVEKTTGVELMEFLRSRVPDYMIPIFYTELTTIPMAASGKVDRKSLPEPFLEKVVDARGPVTPTEMQMVRLWSEVLRLPESEISIAKSFFELGGHSLRAALLVNRIVKNFNVKISIREVFQKQTIAELSAFIDDQQLVVHESISRAQPLDYYHLSPAQRRLYFLHRFDKSSVAYNMPKAWKVTGNLDVGRVGETFKKLIDRHESLRTCFVVINDEPVQKILHTVPFELEFFEGSISELEIVQSRFVRPFDMSLAPLLRAGLFRTVEGDQILMVDTHHIISDGISQGILFDDFFVLYSEGNVADVNLHYKDFTQWLREDTQQRLLNEYGKFWQKIFKTDRTSLQLPIDFQRPVIADHRGALFTKVLSPNESKALLNLAHQENTTLYMLLLGIFAVLLSKMANQEDVVIGTPVSGRPHADLERVTGMFANTLALPYKVDGTKSFREFLVEVRDFTLSCLEHQLYPLEELIAQLNVPRDMGRNPLFDVMFVFESLEQSNAQIQELMFEPVKTSHQISKFDLTLTVTEVQGRICLTVEYASSLFNKESVERLLVSFHRLIESVVHDVNIKVLQMSVLSAEEKSRLLFNSKKSDFPFHLTLVDLFEAQVLQTPTHAAIVFEDKTLTYRELNDLVNQLASQLIARGVKPKQVIGLFMDRSEQVIIALLAILKTGSAYLPIDIDLPFERILLVLQSSSAKFIVSDREPVKNFGVPVIDITTIDLSDQEGKSNPAPGTTQDDLAYIIYTSGSTGTPKGVMVNHRNVVNLFCSQRHRYGIGENERILQFSSLSFDASVEQIVLALFTGSALIMISKETIRDRDTFSRYVVHHRVTHINATPSFLEAIILPESNSVRRIVTGGEECSPQLRNQFINYTFFNAYGPTETTVTATTFKLERAVGLDSTRMPIGKPLDNTCIYIVDAYGELVPPQTPGEVWIGGEGVAKGYIGNERFTAEKFVTDPFAKHRKMIYRTGDLARWLPDGNIEYLGRIDQQVKIRGFRIELGEIESQLMFYPAIRHAVVTVHENQGDKRLAAYYVADSAIAAPRLMEFLRGKLPLYMVPTFYLQLKEIPMTTNGKVDRKLLPEPGLHDVDYSAPESILEKQMTQLWSEILCIGESEISTTQSFFEIGGHSLNAVKVILGVQRIFGVEIPLSHVFRYPTIREFSQKLDIERTLKQSKGSEGALRLNQVDKHEHCLFFIHDGSGGVESYREVSHLVEKAQCWGLQCPALKYYGPQNITFTNLIDQYIEQIKSIQPAGPYRLAGWSLGGVLAYEIANRMKSNGDIIEKLYLIDSDDPAKLKVGTNSGEFTLTEEMKFLEKAVEYRPTNVETLEELWYGFAQKYRSNTDVLGKFRAVLPETIRQLIPHFDLVDLQDIVLRANTIRTLSLVMEQRRFTEILDLPIVYVKAGNAENITAEKWWNNLNASYFEIEGDHFSILKQPHVTQLASVFNFN